MRTACPPGSSDLTAFRGLNCAEERSSAQFLRPRSRFRADFLPRRAVSGPPLRPNGKPPFTFCVDMSLSAKSFVDLTEL